ncbi:actin related protein 2/3 complex, subunit 4 (predicted), isoform CRA_b [Rattus norvegicus]|uniref:Actin related protein 2/3 complex, subunit 4 (Predicted), isoform CRA_b n=1 Tax=Rattus norvegicus TaxID=10116 RepID=A6IBR1_RAT|nr:actin related protein 2/3 complex, subunit 4 (predicted), isoform CRA_b [Rattus norvegicus]
MPGLVSWLRSSSRTFRPSSWISQPSPLASPVSLRLRRCPGVTPRSSGAAAAAAAAAGSWVGWALDAGGGCGELAGCAERQQWTCPMATCVWSG